MVRHAELSSPSQSAHHDGVSAASTRPGGNIEQLIRAQTFLSSAWTLANLYLGTVGAELLSEDAPRLVGLSEHKTRAEDLLRVAALHPRERSLRRLRRP